jgi:hypothetical protein
MVSYSPQQNGVVEHHNQTVVGTVCSMMKTTGMPREFWGEVVMTVVYLLNWSPTHSLEGKTSYEAWHGNKPAVHHLCTFGCVSFMKVTRPHLSKLDDRGKKGVFIGYEAMTKGYRIFNPVDGRVHVSKDVVFDEGTFWSWDINDGTSSSKTFTVEYTNIEPGEGGPLPASLVAPVSLAPASTPPAAGAGAGIPEATPVPATHITPLSNDHDRHDAPSGLELRYRKIGEIIDNVDPPGQVAHTLDIAELHAISSVETSTFAEAEQSEQWRTAMIEEMKSIDDNKTWMLVDLPLGHRVIGLKWVYKLKRNEDRAVVKHKARLVPKGYVQK